MADVFSVVALLIMFREALESAIIISIMLQMCDRLKLQHAKKVGASRCCVYRDRLCLLTQVCPLGAVWAGALSGCGIALIVGVIFIIVFYVAQNSVFSGNGKTVFEGILELIASFLITVLGFAMLKIRGYEAKWEHKLQRQAAAQAAAQTDTTVSTCLVVTTTSISWPLLVMPSACACTLTHSILPAYVAIFMPRILH